MDIEHIYIAAQQKGVSVVSTGDFTHPAWLAEIREKLEPDGQGLFRLKTEYKKTCEESVPEKCRRSVRFILGTEISNIYPKKGRVRKNHNLVFFPDVFSVERLNRKLAQIGNLSSDGRPVLGLDARHLLELVMEVNPDGVFIPAHIWTPWFSLLGSKSGFDSIGACFEDMAEFIFAVETGLSSDPAMNRQVEDLNNIALVSNSDAHSPFNIGREANRLHTERSYLGLWQAVKSKNNEEYHQTIEFYPQEGKYYLDGHRKCNVSLLPAETRKLDGICPKCKKKLTLGVLHRVEELSGDKQAEKMDSPPKFIYSIQLANIIAEILNFGVRTKTVQRYYLKALEQLGCEYDILHVLPISTIRKFELPVLAESIMKMRRNKPRIDPGYDGKYGKVNLVSTNR